MEILVEIFGEGRNLSTLQMCDRAIIIYFIALALLRISGRRTFGKKTAFDNIIVIILGAILSRAVVGASDFLATIASCLVLALMHRVLAWLSIKYNCIRHILEGRSILLYKNKHLYKEHFNKSLVSEDEIVADLRKKANIASLDDAEEVHMETNGQLSVVKKKE